jgi:hypothetical protein
MCDLTSVSASFWRDLLYYEPNGLEPLIYLLRGGQL